MLVQTPLGVLPFFIMDIKQKASLFAIISASVLTSSKFMVGYKSGSMAVISSGLDSMLDIFMSFINFLAIKKASQPADKNHLYGHGKVEDLAAILQALIIVVTGFVIIYKAFFNYLSKISINYTFWDIGVMLLSLFVSYLISSVLSRIGNKTGSNTLKVDALHYSTDLYSNFAAFLAIVVSYFFSLFFIDSLFAILVGFYIIFQAAKIAKDAIFVLMDTSISDELSKKIDEIIDNMPMPYAGYHDMRSRYTGTKKYIDFHLLICRSASIEEAHNMADRIEAEINSQFSDIDVMIHIEPCPYDCDMTEESCKVLKMRKERKTRVK